MSGSPKSPHVRTGTRILNSLRQWGPSTMQQLCKRLGLRPGQARSVLGNLKRKGLVEHDDTYPVRWKAIP